MKRDIEEILNQLVCCGPMNEIPKKIPKTARAIERWVVATICNKLSAQIHDISIAQRFNSFLSGRTISLIEFRKQLMKEYNITEKDLSERKIMVDRG